jgi:hypothetical protein
MKWWPLDLACSQCGKSLTIMEVAFRADGAVAIEVFCVLGCEVKPLISDMIKIIANCVHNDDIETHLYQGPELKVQ